MKKNFNEKIALVTGSAGFIGFHVAQKLLDAGWIVVGVDAISDYYDVRLKHAREEILLRNKNYISVHRRIEEPKVILELFEHYSPDMVIHLAAQAGVRYSIENPRCYLETNIIGTFEILEAARLTPPKHMLLASTSSAYGANMSMPYKEVDKSDHQMSFYAATKKSTENMAHSYSHIFKIPITVFRFFTVYGPWGRPDMALFKFTKAILEGDPIDVYNYGDMKRDFTYVDDLVDSIISLLKVVPSVTELEDEKPHEIDSLSPVAPFRLVNIGNSDSVQLNFLIDTLERHLGMKAKRNLLPMQPGDVPTTWASTTLLQNLIDFNPNTSLDVGVKKFIEWYRKYYNK